MTAAAQSAIIQDRTVRNLVNSARSSRAASITGFMVVVVRRGRYQHGASG